MHRIISNYMKTFSEEAVLPGGMAEDKLFERFANYCCIRSIYPEDFSIDSITSEEDDSGIDGICFFIDGEIAATVNEAKTILERPKKNIPVEVYFIQAKTGDSYERGEILKFTNGVRDFISENPSLPEGDFIREQKEIFNLVVDNIAKVQSGRPSAHLRYVCTSNNDMSIARHIPLEVKCDLLESKMIEAYHNSQDIKWLFQLIRRSNDEAIKEYYELAKTLSQIPDMTEGSEVPYIAEVFKSVTDKKAIPDLVKLLQLTFVPGFKDKEYFGLYSGCFEAIVNISKQDYEEVSAYLQQQRTGDFSPFDNAISDLLNTIRAKQKEIRDAPLSFETVLTIIP